MVKEKNHLKEENILFTYQGSPYSITSNNLCSIFVFNYASLF